MNKRELSSLLDDVGGDPLEGSGFEDEESAFDEEFASSTDLEENEQ